MILLSYASFIGFIFSPSAILFLQYLMKIWDRKQAK